MSQKYSVTEIANLVPRAPTPDTWLQVTMVLAGLVLQIGLAMVLTWTERGRAGSAVQPNALARRRGA
ncbi:MAG: hypothetical protein ACOVN5_15345 [Aquidulcibacter sp.]